ncbi:MAG: DUF5683 domain-containing protein [Dysgonamonadaceae bacterium]|nr:DUF5683 domain-containing protein [Dysgonamonadaceae bacterium]
MKQNILFIIGFILSLPVGLQAQESVLLENDSVLITEDVLVYPDSLDEKMNLEKQLFKPNPTRAVLYSAILPGLGQIYNRKYWKLPIVYGGFLGCAYAITWNCNQYNGYRKAYRDFTDDNPDTNSWLDYKYYSYDEDLSKWTEQQKTGFAGALKNKRDFYRRYTELSYIITIGVYAICMIDAYVDAQLFDFDISEDLTMRVDPVIFEKTMNSSRAFGLQCSFTF